MDHRSVPDWYANGDFERIDEYIIDETERFLHAYQFLKSKLPELVDEYNALP